MHARHCQSSDQKHKPQLGQPIVYYVKIEEPTEADMLPLGAGPISPFPHHTYLVTALARLLKAACLRTYLNLERGQAFSMEKSKGKSHS